MKRYLVFAWPDYEARGGFNDLVGMASTEEEVSNILRGLSYKMSENTEIIDTQDDELMNSYDNPHSNP